MSKDVIDTTSTSSKARYFMALNFVNSVLKVGRYRHCATAEIVAFPGSAFCCCHFGLSSSKRFDPT